MSEQNVDPEASELARAFRWAKLGDEPSHEIEILTTTAERKALASRYSLLSLDALTARMTVRGEAVGEIVVEGRLQAEVVQECVVTLESVSDSIEAPFEQRYTLHPEDPVDDLAIGPDDVDPPEAVTGDSINLGELVAQFLSLSLNPYPRSPEADQQAAQDLANSLNEGPFAVLAKLRDQDPK